MATSDHQTAMPTASSVKNAPGKYGSSSTVDAAAAVAVANVNDVILHATSATSSILGKYCRARGTQICMFEVLFY